MAGRIVVIGDSHIDAIKHALRERPQSCQSHISALRIARMKGDAMIGDIAIEDAVELASSLVEDDVMALAVGGNQHQVFGLVQHPQAFDFFEPGTAGGVRPDHAVIPYKAVWDIFEGGLRGRDYGIWKPLRAAATRCRVYHLSPPPPKADEDHILSRFESAFVDKGLAEKGVTPAEIRLKIWRLQTRVFQAICAEESTVVLSPPPETQTPEGFLKPEFYARDATHANSPYGERQLCRLETLASSRPEAGDFN